MAYTDDGLPLKIEYDEAHDIVTVCGIKYSGQMFRAFGFASLGTWLRIAARRDGVISITRVSEDTEQLFDEMIEKEDVGE